MPQMSPLLWSIIIILSIYLLLITSSFLYFMYIPIPHNIYAHISQPTLMYFTHFNWMW